MKSRPRLTDAVMKGLVELMGVAAQASKEDADRWWTAVEQGRVLRACRWIQEIRRWRGEVRERR